MRKFAFVIPSLTGGGAERSTLILSRALNDLGHRSHVVSLYGHAAYDLSDEPHVHFLPRRDASGKVSRRQRARRLERLVQRLEADDGKRFDRIVAVHLGAHRVVVRCGFGRVLYSVRNSSDGWLARERKLGLLPYLKERRKLRVLHGKDLLAVSQGLRRELEASRFVRPRSVTTLYNPVDVETTRRLAKKEVAQVPNGRFVLHVGRWAIQKRHDVLFTAMRHVPRDCKLVLLVRRTPRLENMIREAGLEGRVVLPGFQQNPYAWMRRAELTVLSSDFEGFPRTLIESIACGTPVVATDCPHGPNEILTGDLARWLVPTGDPDALGKKIVEALATPIDLSKTDILDRVDSKRVARRFLEIAA